LRVAKIYKTRKVRQKVQAVRKNAQASRRRQKREVAAAVAQYGA